MQILSLNISKIREVEWNGKIVRTGIFKEAVKERLDVQGVNIIGDDQADRYAHGGPNKSIYIYPIEHYGYWQNLYPNLQMNSGMFGENLTTQGMLENDVYIDDRYKIGNIELIAVQPRIPCYKLGIKFDNQHIIKQFYNTDYCGVYFKIAKEGDIGPGDKIELLERNDLKISIIDILNIIRGKATRSILEKAAQLKHLPHNMKGQINKLLNL